MKNSNKQGMREQLKDEYFEKVYTRPDYSKVNPRMKQQYTYKDLQDAFEAGKILVENAWLRDRACRENEINKLTYKDFLTWFTNYKFEMSDPDDEEDPDLFKKQSSSKYEDFYKKYFNGELELKIAPLPDRLKNYIPSGMKLISWEEYAKLCNLK